MKQHPLMLDILRPFATIEDVLDDFKELNYVLYNPQLTEEKNKMNLIYITNKVFHRRISDAQLSEFMECGKSVDTFIDKYREWLKK